MDAKERLVIIVERMENSVAGRERERGGEKAYCSYSAGRL